MLRVEELDRDEGWIVVPPVSEVDRAVRTAANGSQHLHGAGSASGVPAVSGSSASRMRHAGHMGGPPTCPEDLSSTCAGGHRRVSARRFRAAGRVSRHPAAAVRDRSTGPC